MNNTTQSQAHFFRANATKRSCPRPDEKDLKTRSHAVQRKAVCTLYSAQDVCIYYLWNNSGGNSLWALLVHVFQANKTILYHRKSQQLYCMQMMFHKYFPQMSFLTTRILEPTFCRINPPKKSQKDPGSCYKLPKMWKHFLQSSPHVPIFHWVWPLDASVQTRLPLDISYPQNTQAACSN